MNTQFCRTVKSSRLKDLYLYAAMQSIDSIDFSLNKEMFFFFDLIEIFQLV